MSAYAGILKASSGATSPVAVNPPQNILWQAPPAYMLGLICTVSAGASLTYSVEVTADQVPSASGNWNVHEILTGMTTSANGNITFPITGIRLNVTTYVSGSVNLGIAQWP